MFRGQMISTLTKRRKQWNPERVETSIS